VRLSLRQVTQIVGLGPSKPVSQPRMHGAKGDAAWMDGASKTERRVSDGHGFRISLGILYGRTGGAGWRAVAGAKQLAESARRRQGARPGRGERRGMGPNGQRTGADVPFSRGELHDPERRKTHLPVDHWRRQAEGGGQRGYSALRSGESVGRDAGHIHGVVVFSRRVVSRRHALSDPRPDGFARVDQARRKRAGSAHALTVRAIFAAKDQPLETWDWCPSVCSAP